MSEQVDIVAETIAEVRRRDDGCGGEGWYDNAKILADEVERLKMLLACEEAYGEQYESVIEKLGIEIERLRPKLLDETKLVHTATIN